MRLISAILVATLLPSVAAARDGYTPHYSAPSVRAAPAYRSAPMVRTSPALRAHQGLSPGVQHPSFSRPAAVVHAPTVQHVPSGFRSGPIQFSRPLHVPRVTRVVARRVPWRGLFIAVPAITALGAPVWLDVPDLGEISVDEQIYITEIYPLLTSEQEADRERAYIRLKELAEAQPTIQETPPDDVAVATSTASAQTAAASSSYTKGLAALREDDFDAAIREFTAAITDDPTDVFPYIRRGTAYEKKGDAVSAIGDYRKVLKLVDAETGAEYAAKIRKLEKTRK